MTLQYYLQVAVSVGVLIGILIITTKFSKNIQKKKYSCEMVIKDRLTLANQSTLFIIKIRDKEFLLSATSRDIQVLADLTSNNGEDNLVHESFPSSLSNVK